MNYYGPCEATDCVLFFVFCFGDYGRKVDAKSAAINRCVPFFVDLALSGEFYQWNARTFSEAQN